MHHHNYATHGCELCPIIIPHHREVFVVFQTPGNARRPHRLCMYAHSESWREGHTQDTTHIPISHEAFFDHH